MEINIEYQPNEKQYLFHESDSDEVVYGGAKGGGKSCALVMECLAYGLEYPGSNMYIFRETYDDLEANIIREWKEKVPRDLYTYNESKHQATLINGTSVKFRYIRNFSDAEGYQGRSMDWIGVDELTKHERRSIQVLLSCLRSPKGYPPRFRATCNPGGIGHTYVKEDYIEPTNYGEKIAICDITGNTKQFIPATVFDNVVLMKNDPNYVKRLENLPETQKKAFLYGDWDIFEGRFFKEYNREYHVIRGFEIDNHWYRYVALDYGLDMLAVGFIAVDYEGFEYLYREIHLPDLIISDAAKAILETKGNEQIRDYYAPGDLWNRRQETGKSVAEIFKENGIELTKVNNDRAVGALSMKEHLKIYDSVDIFTGEVKKESKFKIFDTCTNIQYALSNALADEKDPNKYATEPHDITHILDMFRYYCTGRAKPTKKIKPVTHQNNYAKLKQWNPYKRR